jgi:hypothetical protein
MQRPTNQVAEDTEGDYREIEAALLKSERGRWFLAEHGRRSRRLDRALLEDAIERLQNSIRQPPALLDRLQHEVGALRAYLGDVRSELMAKQQANGEDGAFAAPQEILKAAEDIHEVAWSLQANPFDPAGCEIIARHASRLYVISQAHGFDSARVLSTAQSLDEAADRIDAILESVIQEMKVDSAS